MTDQDFEKYDDIRRRLTENLDPVGAMVEAALLGESEDLISTAYNVAIPRTFNADLVIKLSSSPVSHSEADRYLEGIRDWGFVQELSRSELIYPQEVRQYLHNKLRKDDPDRFLLLNQRAYEFFSSKLPAGFESEEQVSLNLSVEQIDALREAIYHLIQVDPQRGFDLFRKMFLSAIELHLIEQTRTLTKFIKQLDLTVLSTIQRLELTYFDALHDQLDGKIESAEAKFREVISQSGSSVLQAQALVQLGKLYESVKRFDPAIKAFQDARKIWNSLNSVPQSVALLNNIGKIYLEKKEYGQAEKSFQSVLKIFENAGSVLEQAKSLNNLGNLYRAQEEWDKARTFYERSLTLKNQLGDQYGVAVTQLNIGRMYQQLEQDTHNKKQETEYRQRAKSNLTQSLNIFRQLGARLNQALALYSFAILHHREGRKDEALNYIEEAIVIFASLEMSRESERANKLASQWRSN